MLKSVIIFIRFINYNPTLSIHKRIKNAYNKFQLVKYH